MSRPRPRLPTLVLAVLLGAALWAGARDGGGPPTPAGRATALAGKVRCPTCAGLSAAESDSPAAAAIRSEIRRQVEAGRPDAEVLGWFVGRYGPDILLTPEASGLGAVVWALPVIVLVLALAGLGLAFRRSRSRSPAVPSAEDRDLVARALGR